MRGEWRRMSGDRWRWFSVMALTVREYLCGLDCLSSVSPMAMRMGARRRDFVETASSAQPLFSGH